MARLFDYVPVLYEGRPAYEVIQANGRPTGIIRDTRMSANGCAQTMNNDAQRLIKQRARERSRKS
jgi:hypothetical protein